jgi:two-component system response regulator (stage 0 sporulation protein F)
LNGTYKILLVDSDRKFCKTLRKLFENFHCEVATAGDGRSAIDLLSKHPFDLIISEVRMPDLSGIDIMQEVSKRRIKAAVIFLTSFGEVESYLELMNMGAFDYLNKPLNKLEILRIAQSAIKNQSNHTQALERHTF